MRALILWRLIATLLLVAGGLTVPHLAQGALVAVAGDDDDNDNGRGNNDVDGRDDDNDDNGRDDDNDDNGRDDDDDNGEEPVERSAGYRVEVECTVSEDAAESECLFTIVVGDGAEEVDHVLLPVRSVCADVLDGDFEFEEPDSDFEVSGYRADGDDDEPLTMILEGAVSLGGTATYWFETDDRVFPATGPGLVCGEEAGSALDTTTAATPPAGDGPGSVVVQSFRCVGVPADRSAYDWYGACAAGELERQYTLTPLDAGKDELHAAETDDAGEATFEAVTPGTWDLDDETANWCHAESDNVTSEGEVVVETGQTTTIWLFYCEGGGS